MTVDDVVARLERAKRNGSGWLARCPAHEDRNPSLSIREGDDDRVLVHCHAGCTVEQIVAALGLELGDLFPDREPLVELETYRYLDEKGRHLYDVVRFSPKTFRQRRAGGAWGLGSTRRVLYRLPELRAGIAAGASVYVVEGERDVHRLEAEGLVATTCPMGAGKWREDYTEQLAGAVDLVLIADHDEPGIAHARVVAVELERTGIPHRVLVPPTPGHDVSDHLNDLGELEELVPLDEVEVDPERADELAVRFVTAEEFVAHPVPQAEPIVVDAGGSTVVPAVGFVLVYGGGGAGKTTLFLDGSMHFAAGEPWLGGLAVPTRPLRIGWIENEGPQEEFRRKLERKLEAWRGRFPAEFVRVLDRPWGSFDLRLEPHREELARAIAELELDLVIVGPLYRLGMEGGGTPDDVSRFVEFLEDVQRRARRHVSIAVLHHENRAGQVSGAWEGRPDLLVHVQARGHGHTRVFWQKAKWSSALHGTTTALAWGDDEGFELEEAGPARPERVWDAIAEYVLANGGCSWNTVEQHVPGTAGYLRARRAAMLEEGVLVNVGTSKAFVLWHVDDPVRPVDVEQVRRVVDAPADAPASTKEGVSESVGASARRRCIDDAPTDDAPSGAETMAAHAELRRRTGRIAQPAKDVIAEIRRARGEPSEDVDDHGEIEP